MHTSELQEMMYNIYFKRDRQRGIEKTFMWLVEEIGELAKAILKGDRESQKEEIADVFAWLLSLANLLNINLEKVLIEKYPNKCPRCGKNPCSCLEK
ncbi:MAG: MazG nucleotide pyrophosphohydrolase domain-containing protein [Candidatus Asgardarchaeum sp.]